MSAPTAGASDEALLRAGALVPKTRKKALKGLAFDPTRATAHRHPALGERSVVRLGAEPLAEGDALVMQILGFDASEDRGVVGLSRRRALGFPGWALVHQPKDARYALEVLGELRKEARRAKTKPGHAKKGFDTIAERLGKSVPAFLPSYWEEAGRAFLEVGSHKYASQCFERARTAERVHALETDEAHRQASFLEFALAGAVSNKSLATYAKELAKSRTPLEAHAAFHELCVKRTLGGMPPFTGMAKELKRLAKAAKLDPAEQAAALVREVIESPSLVRAAPDFWTSYEKAIVAIAKDSPEVRGRLLRLLPTPSSGGDKLDAWWLGFLGRCGALEPLVTAHPDAIEPEARPAGSAAAWFEGFVAHTQRGWKSKNVPPALFALLRRAAPRLIADGVPLWPANRWGVADLDLTDLVLELGVPVERKQIHTRGHWATRAFDLLRWANAAEQPEHGRDPVHVAAHETLAPLLAAAFAQSLGRAPFDAVSVGKRGLEDAKRAWLEAEIHRLTSEALPSVERTLGRLAQVSSREMFSEVPGAHAVLAAAKVAPALVRTLRGGIYAELGWPALDDAIAKLSGKVELHGAFPFVVATDGVHAAAPAIGGLAAIEAEVRLPKGANLMGARRVGDQMLFLYNEKHRGRARWSGEREPFEIQHYYSAHQAAARGVAAEGGVTEGRRALCAGDSAVELASAYLVSDGVTVWRREHTSQGQRLFEVDPATGARGRASLPAFLEATDSTSAPLDYGRSWLLPVPGAHETTGGHDGLAGLCVRQRPDGSMEARTPDGSEWSGSASVGNLVALVRFPGAEGLTPVSTWSGRRGDHVGAISCADGSYLTSSLGGHYASAPVLPPHWWGALEPRDAVASNALRAVGAEAAERLLAGARLDLADGSIPEERLPHGASAVRSWLPDGTDERVSMAVAEIAAHASRLEARLAKLVADRDPESAAARADVAPIPEHDLRQALGTLFREPSWSRGELGAAMHDAAELFTREERGGVAPTKSSGGTFAFDGLLTHLGAVAHLAASPFVDESARAIVTSFLTRADALLAAPGRLRTYVAVAGAEPPAWVAAGAQCWVMSTGGRDYLMRYLIVKDKRIRYRVLEHAPRDVEFAPPAGTTVEGERTLNDVWRPTAFLAELEARGPIAFDGAAADSIAEATGMSRAQAALLLAGLPNFTNYRAHFLDKETRATLGLKSKEASLARDALKRLPLSLLHDALGALHAGQDAADVWTPSVGGEASPAARLAKVWKAARGERVPIPPELLAKAAGLKRSWTPATTALPMLAAPEEATQLNTDGPWLYDMKKQDRYRSHHAAPSYFSGRTAHAVATFVPFLFDALPVGHALRKKLPIVIEKTLERLRSDTLLLEVGLLGFYGDADAAQNIAAYLDTLGGEPLMHAGEVVGRDAGLVVAGVTPHAIALHCRPARLTDDADIERIEQLGAATNGWQRPFKALRKIGALSAFVDRIAETPVPEGGFEANPLASVPALVARVAEELSLEEDSAALYLMLLTLADARTKRLREITGWTAARLKKAAAPLLDKALVLEAKRSRAGRAWFLPGGWEALKSPDLPIETWKLPLYEATRGAEGLLWLPLEHFVPPAPWHVLFDRAWARVESGDAPRYEETP